MAFLIVLLKIFKIIHERITSFILKISEEFDQLKKVLNNEIELSLNQTVRRCAQIFYDYHISFNNIEGYVLGHKPPIRRIYMGLFFEILLILFLVRTLFMAFSDNPVLQIVFNDVINQLGDRKSSMICAMLLGSGAFTVLIIRTLFNYYELTHRLKFFGYLYDLIENKPAIELSCSRHQRLTLGLHLVTKYVFPFVYRLTLSMAITAYTLFSFLYLPEGSVFSYIMAVLWLVPTYLSFMIIFSMLYLGAITWTFNMFYVKYAFNTIEENIKICLKCRNSKLVIKAISEHRIAVKICEDINDFYKLMNFILYFILSPFHMLNIYFITDESNPINFRITAAVVSIIVYSIIVSLILINSQITESAHRPRKYLYRYLDNSSLPFKRRMKIMEFIEMLCGPDIGFYCWDWFSLNSYEFYQYCAFCASFYLMVSGFLS